jgi:glucosamine-6-phosphate deaminase
MTTAPTPLKTEIVDRLRVSVYPDRAALGAAAAADVAAHLRELLERQDQARMIFAAAPSQGELLEGLAGAEGIDWSRVAAFHMDDYLGLAPGAPQSFGAWLRGRLFDRVRPSAVRLIDAAGDAEAEAQRYAALLREAPIDIVCLGIGENGHIAFNDPPFANFADPELVKVVALDPTSRQQQVNDGCFARLADVPTHALTLTIPALLGGRALFCVVPGPAKRAAVERALRGPIDPACPASALRTHPRCTLYLDRDSYGLPR